ncbi:hypothetical protein HWV62_11874 [Athelia sp. TMB]|nr:hypothetical protein HWV62_11874 [Athelia sp. TMB]
MSYDLTDIKCDQLPLKNLGRAGSFYVKVSVDGREQYRTERAKGRSSVAWNGAYIIEALGSSSVEIEVYQRHTIHQLRQAKCVGLFDDSAENLLKECTPVRASFTKQLHRADKREAATSITFSVVLISQNINVPPGVQRSLDTPHAQPQQTTSSATTSGTATPSTIPSFDAAGTPPTSAAQPDISQLQRDEALASARTGLGRIHGPPTAIEESDKIIDASSNVVNAVSSFATTWSSLLQKIELFVEVADKLAEVIIAQRDRDEALCDLMKTIEDVHSFMIEANPLKTIPSQRKILEDMGRLTVESAYLIRDFTIDKSFWKRIATLTLSGVEAKIKQYDDQFKQLRTAFQERAIVNIEITALRCLVQVEETAKDITFQDMAYAKGAGYDLGKCCLPGTRSGILTELHEWINMPDDEDSTPRVMVLTGVAGCGKSAISNSIARHYDRMKRLGSSVFFERADQAQRHCGNLLNTVARDIANLDAQWRSGLYEVIKGNDSLRQTKSVSRQWESFILEPAKSLNTIGPIVIVIDALDESGEVAARRDLLKILAKNTAELPANFRILVTTRAEVDICRAFSDNRHVRLRPMDSLDQNTINDDIAKFIETQLADIAHILEEKMPNRQWCYGLVDASDHLFQWAATACLAILRTQGGYRSDEIALNLISNRRSLDGLYTTILAREFNEHDELAMARFRRVMGNILAAKEPLSVQCHRVLWRQCNTDDLVTSVVGPLGSLLSGTNAGAGPIRALHTSFFDFLTTRERSEPYYVDPGPQNQPLALACARVMNTGLAFNICGLESSHNTNSAVPDLATRIQNSIPRVLSYSCRFLGAHVQLTPRNKNVHDELRELFMERFLYWLEVLSLERHMNEASRSLAAILAWIQNHGPDLAAFVKDAISFVNVFAPPISESAPHIYLSALPFAPESSLISKQYSRHFPGVLQLLSGSLENWPAALKTIEGHTNNVSSVSYSPDGRHIVSVSWDRSMYIWDAETGEIAAGPFTGHSSAITSVSYSPDGRHIASGSFDQTIRISDALTGEVVAGPFEGHTRTIKSVAWSPDSKYVVSGSIDHTCRVWKIEAGGTAVGRVLEGHSDAVMSVGYSPDGKYIASGSSDGSIRIWEAETYEIVGAPFEGHTGGVSSVAFSPDSRHIVSGSWDKTIRVRSVSTGQLVAGPFEGHSKSITSVAYSKDGKFIATGSHDKTVRALDVQTGATVAGPFEGHSAAVNSVAFSPDGRCIVSGADDDTVRVWDAESIGIAARAVEEGRGGGFLAVACSPNGRHIASGSEDGSVRIWNLETGELVLGPLEGHSGSVRSIAYSPDDKHIVSGSDDKTIRIWSGETGAIVARPFRFHSGWVMAVAWSLDGKYIVSVSYDETIRVWDATAGKIVLGPLTGHGNCVSSVAYSPDGRHIVSGSWDGTIRLWNTETGEMVGEPFEGHTGHVFSVAFSPDGQRAASGSGDKTICVWDIKTGQIVGGPFEGHSGDVNSVVYSPDGKYITSCSDDKTIRMWDVETGETIAGPFTAHSGWVQSVAYTRDGKYLVSGSDDSTIRVWNVKEALENAILSRSNSSAGAGDDFTINKGWVSSASGDLLFWVPSWHREGLLWPSNTAMTFSNFTRLGLSRFVHGVRWQECKGSETV